METIKNNWKFIVFSIFALLLLLKLDEISSNGHYVPGNADGGVIVDTRNGKVYKIGPAPDGGNELRELLTKN
jgi:hypothetical protein